MTVRILVVDDNELLRAGLVTILDSDPGLEVVGQAGDGPAGVRLAGELGPDVVLMDIEMPGGDGITAAAAIATRMPDVRVLVLVLFDLDEYVVEALRAGASGFLVKTTPPGDLVRAVHACAAGETTVGPRVMARLVESYVARPEPAVSALLARLTERELDVLRSMAHGHSNAGVAEQLYLAETTVKTHVALILAKLEVRDRVLAVILAHRSGLAEPGRLLGEP